MKIQFLGTGAADWPNNKDGTMKEFRRLSSVVIDDCLLIDPGPSVLEALKELDVDISCVKYILITHRHKDHFSKEAFDVFLSQGAVLVEIDAGETAEFGSYTVRGYTANHSTAENPLHYLISNGEKSLYYALDGAWLMYDEFVAIKEYHPDYMVLDATIGDVEGDWRIFEHNNLNMVREMKKTLDKYVGRFCISHMAKTLHESRHELKENMNKSDIDVAYDGMIVNI